MPRVKRRAASIGILLFAIGCASMPKHDWEEHAAEHHRTTGMSEFYPILARSYSRGLLSGFAVQFVSGTSIETVTYFFNRKGELKDTQTSIREMAMDFCAAQKKSKNAPRRPPTGPLAVNRPETHRCFFFSN
jgi:hypothetical protein